MVRMISRMAAALAVAVVVGPVASPASPPASAQASGRAAVVVDLGNGDVRSACVRFTEESISAKDALERAQMQPVFRAYSGQGTAVCALCGKGCPADESCLTCGGSNYWAYHRARAGAVAYSPSAAGVSSTRVRDGDVEGWRWGSGGPPPLMTVDQVCGAAAQPSPPPPPPADSGGSGPSPAPPPSSGGDPQSPAPPAQRAPSATLAAPAAPAVAPPETSSTTGPATTETIVVPSPSSTSDIAAASRTRSDRNDSGSEGGSPLSLVGFGLLLAAIGAWAAWARRRARASSSR